MKHKKYGRHQDLVEALPFLAMLAGVSALVALLIWAIEIFGEN